MRIFIIVLITIFMQGCTTYTVKKSLDPVTGVTSTEINVRSTRDLEAPELHYSRTGADAEFDFTAASVDNNTDAYMGMFSGMMGIMMKMMERMMIQIPPGGG